MTRVSRLSPAPPNPGAPFLPQPTPTCGANTRAGTEDWEGEAGAGSDGSQLSPAPWPTPPPTLDCFPWTQAQPLKPPPSTHSAPCLGAGQTPGLLVSTTAGPRAPATETEEKVTVEVETLENVSPGGQGRLGSRNTPCGRALTQSGARKSLHRSHVNMNKAERDAVNTGRGAHACRQHLCRRRRGSEHGTRGPRPALSTGPYHQCPSRRRRPLASARPRGPSRTAAPHCLDVKTTGTVGPVWAVGAVQGPRVSKASPSGSGRAPPSELGVGARQVGRGKRRSNLA